MFNSIELGKEFNDNRMIEKIDFKLTPKDKYIINQYLDIMHIENRSSWILELIERDVLNKIEEGFVVIQ